MSKTGEWIVGSIERLAAETGYPFRFLMVKYFAQIHALEAVGSDEYPLEVLAARAKEREFVLSDEDAEIKGMRRETEQDIEDVMRLFCGDRESGDGTRAVRYDIVVDTSALEKGSRELSLIKKKLTTIKDDHETAKIRKHNHDTLWAVLAGFVACGALVVVFGLIIIGILSYARG